MNHHILVLGGGYAGLLAALRLARRLRGQSQLTLLNASDVFVERIRQHQVAAGATLRRVSLPGLLAGSGVRFVPASVDRIDLERSELRAGSQRFGFDELMLALGSRVERNVPGAREHALTLDAASAPLLHQRLLEAVRSAGRVALVGGGLSGIELAAELRERWPGLPLTLFTVGELGPDLSRRARAHLRRFFAERDVQLREGTRVERVERDAVWYAASGELMRHPAELCVWAGGFVGHELARDAGLDVNAQNQVRVDAALRSSSHPHVSGVGDCAAQDGRAAGPLQLSCKVSLPMAVAAADNIARRRAGMPERPFEFADGGVCISLGRRAGLIDLRHADGKPRELIIAGRWGALLKESICRFTVRRMYWERSAWWPAGSLDGRQATLRLGGSSAEVSSEMGS